MMRKRDVEARAISGLPIDPRDILSIDRDGVLTLRHRYAWGDRCDGRVLHEVTRSARAYARQLGDEHRVWVEVVNYYGDTVFQYDGRDA